MAKKPKIAILWLSACAGCDEAIVDLNESLLKTLEPVDIVLWPVAMDYKYSHIHALNDKEILLSVISGAIRNSEQEELAHLLAKKSKMIFAFGTCACYGGSAGLANFCSKEEIMNWVYKDAPTVVNPSGQIPQPKTRINENIELTLPEFYEQVYALDQIIDVDFYLPGCPPPPDLIINAVQHFLSGDLPPKGSKLASRTALCEVCPRNHTKPPRLEIKEIKRVHEYEADPDRCFLAQGILCLGPMTRSGCGETCISVNTPCRGCFGPLPGVLDAGAKGISMLACILKAGQSRNPKKLMNSLVDPAGYFYRFTQPVSILNQKWRRSND
ncbi:MAG: oxidoreductase [Desulfobacterales bacterium]|nr:oxidoreductase [Desulfobacterales bacterium]